MAKYLSEDQITALLGEVQVPENFMPMSQDSYNEALIASKIQKMKSPVDLLMASINMAIVGYGNQKYGNYRQGDDVVNLTKVFVSYNIKFNNPKSALLRDDDLTPQRLCRFYRFHIRKYILQSRSQSYLFRKYSDRNPDFSHICFRGAEYIEDLSVEQASYLLNATLNMDAKLGTNISERVIRVFEAKGTVFKKPILVVK